MPNWSTLSDDEKNLLVAERVYGFRMTYVQKTSMPYDYLHSPDAVFGEGGVVDKMKERGWHLSTVSFEVTAAIFDHEDGVRTASSNDSTLLEAVCHAACEALGSSSEEVRDA